MRNIKLLIQYDGTRYNGWQSQEHTEQTIQGKLKKVLECMLGEEIDLQGSGRTDAGVHAAGQTANFRTRAEISCEEILDYVNRYLPEDIAVLEATEAGVLLRKTYIYRIWNSAIPNVFERKYMYQVKEQLCVEQMKQAAAFLEGTHDFRAFCANGRTKKSTVRTLEQIKIELKAPELSLHFTGNGFLYHMVRILTGTLLEVGMGKRNPEEMAEILASLDRKEAGPMAPAKGLCLWKVEYKD